MKIEGKIMKVVCAKPNWASIIVKTKDDKVKAAGKIVGNIIEDTEVELEGEFFDDPKYGRQFSVSECKICKTYSIPGIKKFLISFISGIGEKTADDIINVFGTSTLDIIEGTYERLAEIKGISLKKAEKIHTSFMQNKVYSDIMEYFKGDITEHQASQIYEKYQEKAIEVLKNDPYQLIYDINGLGFKKVDRLALASGIMPDSRKRLGAAIIYTLKTLSDSGDVYVDADEIEIKIKECLAREKLDIQVLTNKCADEIINQVNEDKLVVEVVNDKPCIYLKYLNEAENRCAEIIKDMVSSKKQKRDFSKEIAEYERKNNIVFDDVQKEACQMPLNNRFSVITGGPGMGKTTVADIIIKLNERVLHKNTICLAPTGRAAKRLKESTGHEAFTVTMFMLKYKGCLEDTLFIVDEASMPDIVQMSKLLAFVNETKSRICFIGDIYQLPSIGPGNFLRDIIRCKKVPTVTLKFSYRFGGTIAADAKMINEGLNFSDLKFDENVKFIKSPRELSKTYIENLYKEFLKGYKPSDIMVISPMRQKSLTAVPILNESLREIHNPGKIRRKDFDFSVGDRVMSINNDYKIAGIDKTTNEETQGICNGDIGTVVKADDTLKILTVLFDDNREFEFKKNQLIGLVPAYAFTCHKVQGSEAKVVIAVLNNEHYCMLTRNLLYTAVTRAKEKLVIVGDVWAINSAIKNTMAITRNTRLSEKIEKAS